MGNFGVCWRRWVGAVALLVMAGVGSARGDVRLLVVGGGPDAFHNEVFFEKNVRFFRETMKRVGMGRAEETLLFAGGGDVGKVPDVAYRDPGEAAPRVNRLMAQLFGGRGDVDVRYRPHRVKGVDGGATKKELSAWFEKEGKTMTAGDVLLIYVTTHGGGSRNPLEVGKSTISLWPSEEIAVGEFTGLLEKLPAGVQVVTVMVQCYCGGFGEIVFKTGLPPGRVSGEERVGFFATVSTMTSTGCTPDTQEETYADYSTYFFAALGGRDRLGRDVETKRVDLDGDGRVSMAEAHAYAVVTAPSTDVPTTTSELYLRRVSKVDGAAALKGKTFAEIRGKADAVRGGILDELGRELGLAKWRAAATKPATGPSTAPAGDWVAAAFGMVGELEGEKKELQKRRSEAEKRYNEARGELSRAVQERWPELAVQWHPRAGELLRKSGEEIVGVVEGHAAYGKFMKAWKEWDEARAGIQRVDVRRTRAQRFLRTAATVALEGRLGEVSEEQRGVYRRLVEAEGRVLGESTKTEVRNSKQAPKEEGGK